MGRFQSIINHVKETYTRIKNYLTQPVRNRSGQVVGNRLTLIVRDVQTTIMDKCYRFCINRVSAMIIVHIVSFVAAATKNK